MQAAIETQGLVRRYGAHAAVDGVDLMVPQGSVYGFLGPNGAGKTTTIKMILGLIRPSGGTVSVFGADVRRERLKTAAAIGSLVEEPSLYLRLTGRENLEIARRIYGAPKTEIDRLLELCGLAKAANRLAGTYSLGMRQRLGLARALMGRPKLLVLDEPTNGLDPDGIRDIRTLIRGLPEQEGATVFVSSHLLAEVEQMATHVGVMHKGQLLTQGPLDALKTHSAGYADIGVDDAVKAQRVLGVGEILGPQTLQLATPDGTAPEAFLADVNRRLVESGAAVHRLVLPTLTLEDIYLQATGARSTEAS